MTKPAICQKFWIIISKFYIVFAILTLYTGLSSHIYGKGCPAQGPRLTAEAYCKLYAAEAQRQMKLYGIPASITLAQGMFESGYGSSYIAVKGNNHFGIKAYRDWKGPVVRCDDDASNEPFCKFKTVKEGYEYHSKFLYNNTRYAPLFKLSSTDYKGWAKGLQKCGYATNPKYPQMLCDVIERYNLDKYDKASSTKTSKSDLKTGYTMEVVGSSTSHKLYSTARRHGLKFVKANSNDALSLIAKEFNIKERQLRRWNDMPKGYRLQEGEVIYLQAKHSKADKLHPNQVVADGESLHAIAQRYGVTVKSIIRRNKLTTAKVKRGQVLRLR